MIIELYSFRNGYSPIEEFLDSLDAKTYAKVARSIILIQGAAMKTFDDYHKEKMRDPEYKREFDALDPEFEIVKMLIEAREYRGITQKELEIITGIDQATISKVETGVREPGIRVLQKIANGLGFTIKLEPIEEN